MAGAEHGPFVERAERSCAWIAALRHKTTKFDCFGAGGILGSLILALQFQKTPSPSIKSTRVRLEPNRLSNAAREGKALTIDDDKYSIERTLLRLKVGAAAFRRSWVVDQVCREVPEADRAGQWDRTCLRF